MKVILIIFSILYSIAVIKTIIMAEKGKTKWTENLNPHAVFVAEVIGFVVAILVIYSAIYNCCH